MSFCDYFPTVARLLRRWKWVLAYAALAMVALAISTAIALHVGEQILRSRTERLQRDFQKLVVGKTTLAEARGILRVWGPGSERVGRRVDEMNSQFEIDLNVPLLQRMQNLLPRSGLEMGMRFAQACLLMGIHLSWVQVSVVVRGGVVTEKMFTVFVLSPSESEFAKQLGGWVIVASELRLRPFERAEIPKRELQIHPEYVVGHNKGVSGAAGYYSVESEYIWLKFTSGAKPEDLRRLTQFNLDCLTRWHACRSAADLMPEAWKQFNEDLGSSTENPPGFRQQ